MHLIGVWAAAYWDWCKARTRTLSFWLLPVFLGVSFLVAIAAIEILPRWIGIPVLVVVFGPVSVFMNAWYENTRQRLDQQRAQSEATRKIQDMINRESKK